MKSDLTSDQILVDIQAFNLRNYCAGMSAKVEVVKEMIEVIRQANRKGYSDVVRDHARRILPRIEAIRHWANTAEIALQELAK